jgi:CheY-like chemotaxis protein
VATAKEAATAAAQTPYDCVVVQRGRSEDEGLAELERLAGENPPLPVVWYEPGAARSGDAHARRGPGIACETIDEAIDAVALCLRRRVDRLPSAVHTAVQNARRRRRPLAERTALVVDDDIRNIFALTSILEKHGMRVVSAESAEQAIDALERNPQIDVALMDIMMPGMDGFETIREIRRRSEFRSLPIVAVTARAMKGDREKTLRAGAWDYLAKPVDAERLMAVLESWLQR